MASRIFNVAKEQLLSGLIDLAAGGDDIRIALLMSNTTAGTQNDSGILDLADITTLDRCDSTGYSDAALANESVTRNDHAVNTANFDGDDVTFTALNSDASRAIRGVLVYKFVTDDTDSIPIAFLEYASDKTPDDSDFVVKFHADGILKAA